MKRIISLLAAIVTLTAAAQINDSTRLSLTPFFGVGINSPSVKTSGTVSSFVAADAGFQFDWHLTRHWMVGGRLNFQYIDVNINDGGTTLGSVGIAATGTFHLRLLLLDAGLQLNVPVISDYQNSHFEAYNGSGVDIMRHTHGVNLSIPLGVGLQLRGLRVRVGVDIGVTRVYDPNAITSVRNNVFTLTIGYRIPLR